MNVNVRSSECAWKHVDVRILGAKVTGLRGFEYKKTTEKEPIYGAGQTALDINEGNVKVEGNIKVLGYERDRLNKVAKAAGYDDITAVPHEAIVAVFKYKKSAIDPITVDTVTGVAFTEDGSSMNQNDKMREITLPFIAMDVVGSNA